MVCKQQLTERFSDLPKTASPPPRQVCDKIIPILQMRTQNLRTATRRVRGSQVLASGATPRLRAPPDTPDLSRSLLTQSQSPHTAPQAAPGGRQPRRPSLWRELEAGWNPGFATWSDPEPDREFEGAKAQGRNLGEGQSSSLKTGWRPVARLFPRATTGATSAPTWSLGSLGPHVLAARPTHTGASRELTRQD